MNTDNYEEDKRKLRKDIDRKLSPHKGKHKNVEDIVRMMKRNRGDQDPLQWLIRNEGNQVLVAFNQPIGTLMLDIQDASIMLDQLREALINAKEQA